MELSLAGSLYNSDTNEFIREATREEIVESLSTAEGHIRVDGVLCYAGEIQAEAGEDEDYDYGRVLGLEDGQLLVAWQGSECKTRCPID